MTAKVDRDAIVKSVKVIATHAARLYRPDGPPMGSDEVRRRLKALTNRLAAPESLITGEIALADPLGLGEGALKSLERAGRGNQWVRPGDRTP